MRKRVVDVRNSFDKVPFALLFLSMIAFAATTTPIVKAEDLSVTLNPSQGPPDTTVLAVIAGFQAPTTLRVTFGTANVRTITASMYSTLSMDLLVPEVSPGTYTVTVTSSAGGVATETFTVTQAPTPTSSPEETPIETPEETPIWGGPTDSPVTESSGFWSPLTIGIIVAVIATAGFTTFLYVRRGKQETSLTQDTSPYKPRSPIVEPSYKPGASVQQTPPYSYRSPVSSMKSTTPTRVNQIATNTKVCKHCKQNVRDDLNVCPYCYKRLK